MIEVDLLLLLSDKTVSLAIVSWLEDSFEASLFNGLIDSEFLESVFSKGVKDPEIGGIDSKTGVGF